MHKIESDKVNQEQSVLLGKVSDTLVKLEERTSMQSQQLQRVEDRVFK